MRVVRMNLALFGMPLNVTNSLFAQCRADIDETLAIRTVKCQPAKRIKISDVGTHFPKNVHEIF